MATVDLVIRAKEYLRLEFAPEEDFDLELVNEYFEHPLSGPGENAVFRFVSTLGSDKPETYFVLTGKPGITNYYPDWGLSLRDLLAVHVATQFYLGMGVKSLHPPATDARHIEQVRALTSEKLGRLPDQDPVVKELFRIPATQNDPEEIHAAGTCVVDGDLHSFVVGDVPSRLFDCHYPAHLAWRIHFGNLIADDE